jgi:ParB family transcriptional regulator, chromosome partitioning protein
MNKKNEVSKGLRSLLSNIEKTNHAGDRSALIKELTNSIALISPELIEVNPFQPRSEFDAEQLMELAKSIKVSGLIQPITVRSLGPISVNFWRKAIACLKNSWFKGNSSLYKGSQ